MMISNRQDLRDRFMASYPGPGVYDVPPEELVPLRCHPLSKDIGPLMKLIEAQGQLVPISVVGDEVYGALIGDGHHRLAAILRLGLPTARAQVWTLEQRRAAEAARSAPWVR